MNAPALRDWLGAVAACHPDLKLEGLVESFERLAPVSEGGVWEAGLCGRAGFKLVGLRWFGEGDHAAWRGAAARALGVEAGPGRAPEAGFPWLDLRYDAASGRLERTGFLSKGEGRAHHGFYQREGKAAPERMLLHPGRFVPRAFAEAGLDKAFSDFAALCPVKDMLVASLVDGSGRAHPGRSWSLRLSAPVPWPRFLRLDLAAPFHEGSSQSAFLMLNRAVSELAFRDDEVWAYCRQ